MPNSTNNLMSIKLASKMVERHYDKGHIFYMPGDPGDALFLLQAGRVQQYHLSPEGRKLVISVLEPGDIFGITALVTECCHHLFAEAIDDCVVQLLDCLRARELLRREPKVTLLLINRLTQRLGRTQDKLQALAFEPVPVRLARCLVEMAKDGVVNGYSHQEISEIIGTYRETITVALNRFQGEGLIDIGRCQIKILNQAGLIRVANGEGISRARPRARGRALEKRLAAVA